MRKDLTPEETKRLHWMQLYLRLPELGVRVTWPTETACRDRLIAARWPNGVQCPKCGSKQTGHLEKRKIFCCKSCLYQFSPQVGSVLHRSHVTLQNWFRAAEILIWHNANSLKLGYPTGHSLKDELGISYAATFKMKKNLLVDLGLPQGGLIGSCILSEAPHSTPAIIRKDRTAEYLWVYNQVLSRSEECAAAHAPTVPPY
ncbi:MULTISPECIES: transposase [unclassified Phaeobacter]|uniref:transposase n=1 Tax=unclassified Phaeobacter TaxID=2621772 RepID=UPI003A844046